MCVGARTLDAGIKEFRFVGPDGLAAVIGHLVLRRSRCSIQCVHCARIGISGCQSASVNRVETDVRAVGHADNALERFFHPLRYYEATFSEIEYGFPSRQAVLLLHGIEQGKYIDPPSVFPHIALLAYEHLQNHLGHGHVGHPRAVHGSSLSGEGGLLIADLPLDGLHAAGVRTDHLLQLLLNHGSVRGEIGILASRGAVDGFTQ